MLQDSSFGATALGNIGGGLGVAGISGPGVAVTFNIYEPNTVGTGFSSTVNGTLSQGNLTS